MISNNRIIRNIEAATSEVEATIEMKLDKITADHTKIIDSFNMNISAITLNKTSSSYEQPFDYIIKWSLLKSTGKYSHASQFTKNMSSANLEGDTLLKFKNYGVPFIPPSDNTYH